MYRITQKKTLNYHHYNVIDTFENNNSVDANIDASSVCSGAGSSNVEIPKHIWTFWDSDNLPNTVIKCIDSWKKYNPDYEITLLKKETINQYIPETDIYSLKHANTPQRISDFVRIHVLKKYGGFWIDASILLTDSLEFIRKKQQEGNYELVGYYIDKMTTNFECPIIENWFFAALPNSTFLNKWCDAFLKINDYDNMDDYVKYIENEGVNLQKIEYRNYLTMHVAAQYVFQKQMTPTEIKLKLYLMSAHDGPFKYLVKNDWDNKKALTNLCTNPELKNPIIKFCGGQRSTIENNQELQCVFNI
jgi:hypothetical protein